MSGKMFAFVCSVFLFVISLTKSQQNFTNEDDNLTIRYEINTDSTTNYNDEITSLRHDLYKNLMNDTQNDKMQHKFHINIKREDDDLIQHELNKHSMQNKDDEQKSMKSNTNSTNVNHRRNFMSQEVHENVIEKNDSMSLEVFEHFSKDANETNIVPNDMCHNDTCIRFCCSLGDRLVDGKCIPKGIEYIFPKVYTNDSTQSEKRVNELFQLTIYDPCQKGELVPISVQYAYKIFTNGSVYVPYFVIEFLNGSMHLSTAKMFVEPTSYCLAVVDGSEFEMIYCSETNTKTNDATNDEINGIMNTIKNEDIMEISVDIASILFLGSAFLVYSILPELRNKHGFMLRNYNGALTVVYGIRFVHFLIKSDDIQYAVCITIAFLEYFCYMASFFWLNIMSFDMWCTFRQLCSLQRNVRERGKRKLIYYTIFAWGCPFMFAILSVSMDILSKYHHVPSILRPEFYVGYCWFFGTGPYLLYYYVLSSMCVINSICLSIYTALKIERFKKETGPCLNDSENKCFNDNKKWFNLYLQLFIVLFVLMGIEWLLITASLATNVSIYYIIWYAVNSLDIMQSLCVFIIFVCKKRIKRMLFKQFGCGLLSKA